MTPRKIAFLSLILTFTLGQEATAQCGLPPPSPVFVEYCKHNQELFEENRRGYFPLETEVQVRYILMSDGVIRYPEVVKSSGNIAHDLSCLDAVVSASPLEPPPLRQLQVMPPPFPREGEKLRPLDVEETINLNDVGSGWMIAVFKPTASTGFRLSALNSQNSLEIPLIPMTIVRRFPGAFSEFEYMDKRNYVKLESDRNLSADLFPEFRYPWVELLRHHQKANREEVLYRLTVSHLFFFGDPSKERWEDRWKSGQSARKDAE